MPCSWMIRPLLKGCMIFQIACLSRLHDYPGCRIILLFFRPQCLAAGGRSPDLKQLHDYPGCMIIQVAWWIDSVVVLRSLCLAARWWGPDQLYPNPTHPSSRTQHQPCFVVSNLITWKRHFFGTFLRNIQTNITEKFKANSSSPLAHPTSALCCRK